MCVGCSFRINLILSFLLISTRKVTFINIVLPKLVHGIVLRIQLVVQIMSIIFQTGFTHLIVLGNLTRADALGDSFPSTIDNS
jgi:hypothetical protein